VLLLPLTFVWKLTVKTDDSTQLKDTVTRFLVLQKFEVSDNKPEINGMPVIRAMTKTCRIFIMRASPDGWTRDLINEFGTATDHIFIVFRGKIYDEQVSWRIIVGYLQSRILHRLGLVPHTSAVIAVVAAPACDAERLPWDKLRDL